MRSVALQSGKSNSDIHIQNSRFRIQILALIFFYFTINSSRVAAQIILEDSFEAATLNENIWEVTWWTPDGQLEEDGIQPEIVTSPVRAGNSAVKISAEANWGGYDDYSRTEILGKRNDTGSFTSFFYHGQEYWIGFSVYLPSDWQIDNLSREVIFQLHGNQGGGQYGIPPFALIVDGDEWFWGISSDQDPTPDEADEYGRETLTKGEWVDFVVHIKFSYSNDGYGFLEIWENGNSLFTRNGPNCYYDDNNQGTRGPQTGIYKWDWAQSGNYEVSERTMYLDEIKVGGANSTYEDVAPEDNSEEEINIDSGICLEAEEGVISGMEIGSFYIKTISTEEGTASYTFTIDEAANYTIDATVFCENDSSDSIYYTIDDNAEEIWDFNPEYDNENYNTWIIDEVTKRGIGTYDNPEQDPYLVYLTAGTHTISFRGREPEAKLDEFCFVPQQPLESFDYTKPQILLYPNPSTGVLDFSFSSNFKGVVSIRVLALDGKIVKDINAVKNSLLFTQQINLSNVSDGVYFLQFKADNNLFYKKIVKH